mgnify:CR=1 FL=1
MTEWSPGSAPTTSWSVNAGMDPSDPGVADNLASLAERAETAATNAETAETNAETAETSAETAKTAAETAKAAAETAETNAETAETNAETAETNASTSASAAASSASAASTSASTATTKASEASSSASAASTSETNASNSASAASTSATNASSSASSASTSATSAAASYDSFDDRYLGAKTSDPGADNDGNALITGALFFNSSTGVMQVYNGSQWVAAASSIEGIKSDFTYTATANQTVFSGADANSSSLVIDQAGLTSAFLNGVRLVQGTDYSVNVGANSITLTAGAALNDTLEVEVFGNFEGQSGASVAITGGSIAGLTALGVSGNITVTGTVDGRDVATDGTKLDGIEAAATADQTAAEIRTLVDNATDSNVFTDDDHTKLNGIEASATADQSAAEILTALLTVDGTGTTLDADLLDGQHGSYYTGYTDTAITNLVDSAPGALNTLNELAAALGDDVNFSTTVTNSIATKLPLAGGTLSGSLSIEGANELAIKDRGSLLLYNTNDDNYARIRNTTASGNELQFSTNAVAMTIDVSGNVGIGETSPASPLTVKGSFGYASSASNLETSTTKSAVRIQGSSDASTSLWIGVDTTDAQPYLQVANAAGTGSDDLLINPFGGNVGIGTTAPSVNTEIRGSASNGQLRLGGSTTATYGNIYSDNDGVLILGADAGNNAANSYFGIEVDGSERMRIDSSGNVGIGVTPSAMSSTYDSLQVGSVGTVFSHDTATGDGSTFFGSNVYNNSGWKYITTNEASFIQQKNGSFSFARANSGTADSTISFTYPMTLNADGNLSLGTTDPIVDLGDGRTTLAIKGEGSTDYVALQLASGGTSSNGQALGLVQFYDGSNENARIVAHRASSTSSADLRFDTRVLGGSRTERMRITSAGNVSIINGNLIVASGHGIDFSASEGTNATSSVLDDYEEGTWVPTLLERSGTTIREIPNIVYSTSFNGAWYTKVGNVVNFGGNIRVTANGDPTSSYQLRIGGLPFTSVNPGGTSSDPYGRGRSAISITIFSGLDGLAADEVVQPNITQNANYITMSYFDSGSGAGFSMPSTFVQDDCYFSFGGSFVTAA